MYLHITCIIFWTCILLFIFKLSTKFAWLCVPICLQFLFLFTKSKVKYSFESLPLNLSMAQKLSTIPYLHPGVITMVWHIGRLLIPQVVGVQIYSFKTLSAVNSTDLVPSFILSWHQYLNDEWVGLDLRMGTKMTSHVHDHSMNKRTFTLKKIFIWA